MFSYDELKTQLDNIQGKLRFEFKNPDFLLLSFVHSSYVNENRHLVQEHNERLEFLGDAVLGLLISDFLYTTFPGISEGRLSAMRSWLVCSSVCMRFVQKLKLEQYLLLGKGESLLVRGKETILADLFEALIGAIYLDGGLQAVKTFFFQHFLQDMQNILHSPDENFKADLQVYAQKHFSRVPQYRVLEESGPDHNKYFTVAVFLQEKELARGEGANKKTAEQNAAKHALEHLQNS